MYTLSTERWVGGRSFKVARKVALDQNGNSKTLHADPPTHRNNARLCISHRCALFTTTISAVKPRPPARMIGSSSFLFKAAELKRFRSHPLSSAVNPGEQEESNASVSPSAADCPREHIATKCKPLRDCTALTMLAATPGGKPPGHRSTRKPLGTKEVTHSDGDTSSRHKTEPH